MQEVSTNIDALQAQTAALKSRLLLIYNLTALAVTLLLIWLTYSQIVVIRQQWSRLRSPATASPALPSPDDGAASGALSPASTAVAESTAEVEMAADVLPEQIAPPVPGREADPQ